AHSVDECVRVRLRHGFAGGAVHQDADGAHLLRARREPPRRCAGKPCDEFAPLHSNTSSAATSRPGGTVSPSALAVLRLTVVSYLVGACTGRSAGLAPRRMRSMYEAP